MKLSASLLASLYVVLGGGAGALLRYQISRAMAGWLGPQIAGAFPWATLAVNTIGSMLMGVLVVWLARYGEDADHLRLLLGVGLLGGFTTFSAFSLEMVLMIERGQLIDAALYLVLSVVLGVSGLFAGHAIMRFAQ